MLRYCQFAGTCDWERTNARVFPGIDRKAGVAASAHFRAVLGAVGAACRRTVVAAAHVRCASDHGNEQYTVCNMRGVRKNRLWF